MKTKKIMDVCCPVCGKADLTEYVSTSVNSVDSMTTLRIHCANPQHKSRPFLFEVILYPDGGPNRPIKMVTVCWNEGDE